MRKTLVWVPVILIAFAAGVGTTALVSSTTLFENGALKDRVIARESFDFGTGNYTLLRQPVLIPPEYGKLLSITSGSSGTIFWYEDADNVIRNVIINGETLSVIRRAGKMTADSR